MKEEEIVERFYELSDGEMSCACARLYINGIWIETHCHRTDCEYKCRYAGIHIGTCYGYEDRLVDGLDVKKIGELMKAKFEEMWMAEFNLVILPEGSIEFH